MAGVRQPTYLVFIAALQDGSRVRIEAAIDGYSRDAALYLAAGGSADAFSSRQEFDDMVRIFLDGRASEVGWRDWMENAPPSLIMASAYAHIGETDRAAEMIKDLLRRSAFLESFEIVSHGGPLALPEDFLQSSQYRKIWGAQGMAELAAIRRANGRPEGLPSDRDFMFCAPSDSALNRITRIIGL